MKKDHKIPTIDELTTIFEYTFPEPSRLSLQTIGCGCCSTEVRLTTKEFREILTEFKQMIENVLDSIGDE